MMATWLPNRFKPHLSHYGFKVTTFSINITSVILPSSKIMPCISQLVRHDQATIWQSQTHPDLLEQYHCWTMLEASNLLVEIHSNHDSVSFTFLFLFFLFIFLTFETYILCHFVPSSCSNLFHICSFCSCFSIILFHFCFFLLSIFFVSLRKLHDI